MSAEGEELIRRIRCALAEAGYGHAAVWEVGDTWALTGQPLVDISAGVPVDIRWRAYHVAGVIQWRLPGRSDNTQGATASSERAMSILVHLFTVLLSAAIVIAMYPVVLGGLLLWCVVLVALRMVRREAL